MFGISGPELLVVAIIALLVFGPDKLPELARTAGKLAGQFRRQSDAVRREFYNTVYRPAADLQTRVNLETRALRTLTDTSVPPVAPQGESPAPNTNPAAAQQPQQTSQPSEKHSDETTPPVAPEVKPRDPQ